MSCCDTIVVEDGTKMRSTPFFIRFEKKARIRDVVEIYVPNGEVDLEKDEELIDQNVSLEDQLKNFVKVDLELRLEAGQEVPFFDRIDVVRMKKKKKLLKPGKKALKNYHAEEQVKKAIDNHDDEDKEKIEKISRIDKTKAQVVNTLLNSEKRLEEMREDMVYDPVMITPTSNELKLLNLKPGINRIKFAKRGSDNQISEIASGHIFLWSKYSKIILCDIDGTVTKSDKLGILAIKLGEPTYIRPGIASLLSSIEMQGYKIVYLTARAITQGRVTRKFMLNINENGTRMPIGPIITSYNTFTHAALREYLYHRSDTFKIGSLKMLKSLFPSEHEPFVAGFGNKASDHQAYLSVGITLEKIYIIDKDGAINKLSENPFASYSAIQKTVDTVFPRLSARSTVNKEEQEQSDNN